MEKKILIAKKFFEEKKTTIDIACELNVSKQYVSKFLRDNYLEEYEEAKNRRKEDNRKKRNRDKEIAKKKRKALFDDSSITVEDLRRQQETAARALSRSGHMSTKAAVFASLNAYKTKGKGMVYNEKIGARPNDLPKRFSLEIEICR